MHIVVLVKNVPEVAEAELEISPDGAGIEPEDLVFSINEWDNYAVEEAVRLKEAQGGTVSVITLGGSEDEDVLRRALAMGADQAMHLCDPALEGSDPAGLARAFAAALGDMSPDLILTGVQSADCGWGQTGVLLAGQLGLPHATLAVGLEVGQGQAVVTRELEANTSEKVSLPLPALVTIQSGINQPRYVSIMGIRKVRSKPIDLRAAGDLGLGPEQVGPGASALASRRLSLPQPGQGAELLSGSLNEISAQAVKIIQEKGGRP